MPYISKEDRQVWAETYNGALAELAAMMRVHAQLQPDEVGSLTDGVLNFLLTAVAEIYRSCWGDSYGMLSDIVKTFECAKLEFYRRVLAPYEDAKCVINGDVYAPVLVAVPAPAD